MSEIELLNVFRESRSEPAFAELVRRYAGLVYSAARRRLANASLADDITQLVFIRLAKTPPPARTPAELAAWLHRTTVNVTIDAWRSETRRRNREQHAIIMEPATPENSVWEEISPSLDDALNQLNDEDRQALLLRFFGSKAMREVGAAMGVSEDAAKMRVSRALERLRTQMGVRSAACTLGVLAALLTERSVEAVPMHLLSRLSAIKLPAAVGAGGMFGALLLISKFNLAAGAAALLLIGAGAVHYIRSSNAPAAGSATANSKINSTTAVKQITSNSAAAARGKQLNSSGIARIPGLAINSVDATNHLLVLNIVTEDSGKPIPNVEFDCWISINGISTHKDPLRATRFGVCNVPVPDQVTELRLTSQMDGFASTRLDWLPERGEQIPGQYTLRLARAVSIGGMVVGPDGNLVAGAKVGFEPRSPSPQSRPQSDNFPFGFQATSDADGRWQLNRIGRGAFGTIQGIASHPDFVPTLLSAFDNDAVAQTQLLAGTYVFHLQHAVVVSGVVFGPDGQPVADADVLVGDPPGEFGARKTKTGKDGSFLAAGCRPGDNKVTADARGFAAKSISVTLSDTNCGPFQLMLNAGKILKLRVMDSDSNPVAGAMVTLDPMADAQKRARMINSPKSNNITPAQPAVRFNEWTDAEGRLEWDSAPDTELTFLVGASNYMMLRGVKARPDGVEHVVTLVPALTVSGTVTDATTGQPIPHFRVTAGEPEEVMGVPHWSSFERDSLPFGGGKFQFPIREQLILGEPDPGYMFKFEADGYAPFVTRVVRAAERSVQFDVTLTPAATTEVTVFSPDQRVSAGTQIGLVMSDGPSLKLAPGGFSPITSFSGQAAALLTTDHQGHFALPPDPDVVEVVAAGPQGFAEAMPKDLARNPVINLMPWGRIEGTFVSNGVPMAGRILSIGFGQRQGRIMSGYPQFQAVTDDQGRFVFEQVPSGEHDLRLVKLRSPQAGMVGSSQIILQPVTILTNQITTVTIDFPNTMVGRVRSRPGQGP